MKLVKRSYHHIDSSIESIGIENIRVEKLSSIINGIHQGNDLDFFIGSTPFRIISEDKKDAAFTIDGVEFSKIKNLDEAIKNCSLKSTEEIILIFTKKIENFLITIEKQISISKHNTRFFSLDPYYNIKSLCLVNNSVILFYSPNDSDIDFYIRKGESASLIERLANVN